MKRYLKFFAIVFLLFINACTTQKNTPVTRAYHNLTAHYNVYFNGMVSYEEGVDKVNEYPENYTNLLPVFKYDIDEAVKKSSADMDRTLTKMGKTIKVHSITVKPKLKGNLTPKQKAFMQKNEYCKWIDDAYLLIGKADFYKGYYDKALRSFHNIENNFKEENTRFDAELWIARVYLKQNKFKDAFELLSKLENDERFPKRLQKDLQLTFADFYIKKKDYQNAIFRLKKSIDLTKKKKEKARYYYILAQLEHLSGNDTEADKYYKKVVKISPDYDMTFNAKINRAILSTANSNPEQLKRQLLKLLKDEKNEDYQDQIYFALAKIELNAKDTAQALEYLKLSAQKSTKNNTQKAISYLTIADIDFNRKNFLEAGKYYDSTMQFLDKKYPDYEKVSRRAKNTGLLVQYLGEVMYQDSLQRVARMPENQRNKLIDSLIQDVIAKEQQKRQEEQDNMNYFDPTDFNNTQGPTSQGGKWYMYNPVLVSRGKAEFKKKWGNRKLEDDWRRKNKAIVSTNEQDTTAQNADSTKVTDNKSREYYLQNLPLNDSLMALSNQKIETSLFKAADVYQNLLIEYNSAIKYYKELLQRFPDSEYKLEVYYRLYKIYKKLGDNSNADIYKSKIINEFPASKYAKLLIDPDFGNKLKAEQQASMNIYYQAINYYNKEDYNNALKLLDKGIMNYPQSDAYPNYLFLKGKTYGHLGQRDSMIVYLKKVKTEYASTDIAKVASDILDMMKETRYNYNLYKLNPSDEYYFAIVLPSDEYTPQLNFNLKHQAELFSDTKVFTIKKDVYQKGYKIVTVHKFDNLKEAKKFLAFINNASIFDNVNDANIFLISKTNFDLLMKDKILEKYLEFYRKSIENVQN